MLMSPSKLSPGGPITVISFDLEVLSQPYLYCMFGHIGCLPLAHVGVAVFATGSMLLVLSMIKIQ